MKAFFLRGVIHLGGVAALLVISSVALADEPPSSSQVVITVEVSVEVGVQIPPVPIPPLGPEDLLPLVLPGPFVGPVPPVVVPFPGIVPLPTTTLPFKELPSTPEEVAEDVLDGLLVLGAGGAAVQLGVEVARWWFGPQAASGTGDTPAQKGLSRQK